LADIFLLYLHIHTYTHTHEKVTASCAVAAALHSPEKTVVQYCLAPETEMAHPTVSNTEMRVAFGIFLVEDIHT
jgi:Asp-tRNA(Asn)/Glu-tRNA(Gln) amidotransferase B subunit